MVECHFRDGPAKDKIITTQALQDIICMPAPKSFSWITQESTFEHYMPETIYYLRLAVEYSLDMKPLKAWYTSNA